MKTSFSSKITWFFSMSSFAASSFACITPAAFVAASRSSLASFNCCSSLITLFWYSSRSSVVASSWAQVREAVTTLEELDAVARRIYGENHSDRLNIYGSLERARKRMLGGEYKL